MLILHGSLHILVAHRSHHGSQVSGLLQNPGTVIVSPTIQDKIFRKPSLGPGFTESCCHCCEVGGLGALRWEDPSFAPCAAPLFKNFIDAIAHRHASPSLFGLAVWHKDDARVPIQVLNAHPVKLSLSFRMPVSRANMMMSRKSCKLSCGQLQAAAPANNFFSASSSSRSERPYSFISLTLGACRMSFHSPAL